MPCLFRGLFVAAATLLGIALAGPLPALAEMTETDSTGRSAFLACLDEAGGNEEACLDRLGYYGWYPRDDAACEAVAATVRQSIAANQQTEWRDLFMNERCVRLDMPHDREAAAAGDTDPETGGTSPEGEASRQIYQECLGGKIWREDICFEEVGRHRWFNEDPIHCAITRGVVKIEGEEFEVRSWKLLFYNERCHRRGVWHYERAE